MFPFSFAVDQNSNYMRKTATFYGFNLHENDWKYTRIPERVKSGAHFPNTKQQGIVLIKTPILFF